jgi:fumarate hydratase class II
MATDHLPTHPLPTLETMTETSVEQDSLGSVEVPAYQLWGAQAQRTLAHFSIGEDLNECQ